MKNKDWTQMLTDFNKMREAAEFLERSDDRQTTELARLILIQINNARELIQHMLEKKI
jgi:hypothetical protein